MIDEIFENARKVDEQEEDVEGQKWQAIVQRLRTLSVKESLDLLEYIIQLADEGKLRWVEKRGQKWFDRRLDIFRSKVRELMIALRFPDFTDLIHTYLEKSDEG